MDNSDKSEAAGVGNASGAEHGSAEISSKGKGKAVDNAPQDVSMDEDEDDSDEDEETGAEDEVGIRSHLIANGAEIALRILHFLRSGSETFANTIFGLNRPNLVRHPTPS